MDITVFQLFIKKRDLLKIIDLVIYNRYYKDERFYEFILFI